MFKETFCSLAICFLLVSVSNNSVAEKSTNTALLKNYKVKPHNVLDLFIPFVNADEIGPDDGANCPWIPKSVYKSDPSCGFNDLGLPHT